MLKHVMYIAKVSSKGNWRFVINLKARLNRTRKKRNRVTLESKILTIVNQLKSVESFIFNFCKYSNDLGPGSFKLFYVMRLSLRINKVKYAHKNVVMLFRITSEICLNEIWREDNQWKNKANISSE